MKEEIKRCPYCGSENFEWMGDAFGDYPDNEEPFHCHECDSWFGPDTKEIKKSFIKWHGESFPVREIMLPEELGGYETLVADYELWKAIEEEYDKENHDAEEIDNEIYFYFDSGFIASDPTDEEILKKLALDCS